ncbi:hypothetical protein [Streptomyces sp. NPDC005281]|uniref:hypothetical protein n=1 Tax=Streptomyces sp. NPDC005281 TaxID=3155712 RepID=UPI0033B86700
MANGIGASGSRNRLTRRRPEARLARDLLKTEYGLRNRAGGGADADSVWERLAAELRRILRRFTGGARSAPGGQGPAPGGGSGSALGGGPEGGPGGESLGRSAVHPGDGLGQTPPTAPAAGPRPGSENPSVHEGMALLEERIRRLPPDAREAFEDAVLHLVRTDQKWKKAYEESPESMPAVARYAGRAHLRELGLEAASDRDREGTRRDPNARQDSAARQDPSVRQDSAARLDPDTRHDPDTRRDGTPRPGDDVLRSRWERPARRLDSSEALGAPTPRSGFDAPGPDEMTDGHGFQEAERLALAEQTTGATFSPRAGGVTDGHGFQEAERLALAEQTTGATFSPRAGGVTDGHGFLAAERADRAERAEWDIRPADHTLSSASPGLEPPVSPMPSRANPLSPSPNLTPFSPSLDRASPLSPLLDQATPVSPLLGAAPVPSLLSGDGHRALRESPGAFSNSSAPGSTGSPSRSGSVSPVPVRQNPPARNTARRA